MLSDCVISERKDGHGREQKGRVEVRRLNFDLDRGQTLRIESKTAKVLMDSQAVLWQQAQPVTHIRRAGRIGVSYLAAQASEVCL